MKKSSKRKKSLTIPENIHRRIYVYKAKLNSVVDPYKYSIHYHWEWEMTYEISKTVIRKIENGSSTHNFAVEKEEEFSLLLAELYNVGYFCRVDIC